MKRPFCLPVLLVCILDFGAALLAQQTDLSGTWVGFAERRGSQDELTVVLEKKDGRYAGKLTDNMGVFTNSEIKNCAVKDDKVTFEFDGGAGGQTFTLRAELTLKNDTMKGTWTIIVGTEDSGTIEVTRKK